MIPSLLSPKTKKQIFFFSLFVPFFLNFSYNPPFPPPFLFPQFILCIFIFEAKKAKTKKQKQKQKQEQERYTTKKRKFCHFPPNFYKSSLTLPWFPPSFSAKRSLPLLLFIWSVTFLTVEYTPGAHMVTWSQWCGFCEFVFDVTMHCIEVNSEQ